MPAALALIVRPRESTGRVHEQVDVAARATRRQPDRLCGWAIASKRTDVRVPPFVGTWRIVSVETTRPTREALTDWLGKRPTGTIMHLASGYMAVQIMRGPRPVKQAAPHEGPQHRPAERLGDHGHVVPRQRHEAAIGPEAPAARVSAPRPRPANRIVRSSPARQRCAASASTSRTAPARSSITQISVRN